MTCQKQPALGCVYKLVEIKNVPRIKLSEEVEKVVIPCRKNIYRLWGGVSSFPLIDVIQSVSEPAPEPGVQLFCRHPFIESRRAHITPTRVENLISLAWDGENGIAPPFRCSLVESRERCLSQVAALRSDHLQPVNPTPYKVSVSSVMYDYFHELWLREAPIAELK